MQVKERRERARSRGNLIGVTGQLVKERDCRVERDLRAV
jgi:outer membrane PBP1 activator LpoA protein